MVNTPRTVRFFGFSLIELMIVVVIIGVLASIAIPNYTKYVRKSRTAEAEANINSIGQYQEQYYSENNRYTSAGPNPATVPYPAVNGGVLPFNTTNAQWSELGAIFTNNTQVRFQYRAFAGQFTGNSTSATGTGLVSYTADFNLNSSATAGGHTCSSLPTGNATYFGITQAPFANWFVITAVGNQLADSTCSLFGKVNDRPAVSSLNPTE
ncbi:MAG: prepilin-type N-terminal cleavage/methylation domain-containing protein [Proteobacteria bacterium]|jgi:prepilin-type N-terminal cleavage/methylation domain-containing protein|nr:prepilin-type N-terminal cleavage/methylation domain-containing protein [Pseudomonadota bacterium]